MPAIPVLPLEGALPLTTPALEGVQEALDSVTERLDSVQSHHQLLLQSALDPLIRSPTHVVVGL